MSELNPHRHTEPGHISEFLDGALKEIQRAHNKGVHAMHRHESPVPSYTSSVWADYSNVQLADLMTSSEVPGSIKDDIAKFVLEREVHRKSLPPEGK